MIGQLYIDGLDAYTTYGCISLMGSYGTLVAFPPSKTPDSNDYPEEDGQEYDLSRLTLDTKDLTLEFGFLSEWKFNNFISMLSGMGYHEFRFPLLGQTYKLRLASQSSFEMFPNSDKGKFTFANDFPRDVDYVYQELVNSIRMPKGYEIDDKDLSDYGVMILQGSNAEILKAPAVKKNLLQNFKNHDGAIYDGEVVKFQTKDVSLQCLMRAPNIETFWRNRDALLHDLTKLSTKTDTEGYGYKDAERSLYCDEWSESYPCFYKSCQTTDFLMNDGVWWEFTLTLTFTCFRLRDTDYLLATEAGEFIITEDGIYIDLEDYAN